VRWVGYGERDDTWETEEALTGCQELLLAWKAKKQEAERGSRSRSSRRADSRGGVSEADGVDDPMEGGGGVAASSSAAETGERGGVGQKRERVEAPFPRKMARWKSNSCWVDSSLTFAAHTAHVASAARGGGLPAELPVGNPFSLVGSSGTVLQTDVGGAVQAWWNAARAADAAVPADAAAAQAVLNAARDSVRREFLARSLTRDEVENSKRLLARRMSMLGNAVAAVEGFLSKSAATLSDYLQRRVASRCSGCGRDNCASEEDAVEWTVARPILNLSAEELAHGVGPALAARFALSERATPVACVSCLANDAIESGERVEGTKHAVVFGQHSPSAAAWQAAADLPPVVLAELPEQQQPNDLKLNHCVALPVPSSAGGTVWCEYSLTTVLFYDGAHYVCDIFDTTSEQWLRCDACDPAPVTAPSDAARDRFWPVLVAYARSTAS